jgi:hypothetical protein
MNILTVSVLSKEYIKARVRARENGSEINPTSYTVDLSCPAVGVNPTAWTSGTWEVEDGTYWARILIGPGSALVLTVGTYDVWVRITAPQEVPIKKVGQLKIV